MQIAIITTPREPAYVYETVRQVDAGKSPEDSIEIFSDDPRHEQFIEENGEIIWQTWDKTQKPLVQCYAGVRWLHPRLQAVRQTLTKGGQKACLNFFSALTSGWGDILLLEDDIELASNWRSYLQGVNDQATNIMVSLYWPTEDDLAEEESALGYTWRHYKEPLTYHGSLGLMVHRAVRYGLAEHIAKLIVWHQEGIQELLPFDNCVASFLREENLEYGIVATVPALVDHRGEISAIPENASHGLRKSPGFR